MSKRDRDSFWRVLAKWLLIAGILAIIVLSLLPARFRFIQLISNRANLEIGRSNWRLIEWISVFSDLEYSRAISKLISRDELHS